jgi:ABC-type antimicrobial peptide transport system permease subunit
MLHKIDPRLGVSDEATMMEKIDATQAALLHRFAAWLVGGFAATALILGVVGLYGVIAYSVGQRTREIGVRMALGASRGSVFRMIYRQSVVIIAAGLGIGLALALLVAHAVGSLVVVSVWDPGTYVLVAVVLGLAALASSFLPARRATAIEPMVALRED